jgi:hypothetical protein
MKLHLKQLEKVLPIDCELMIHQTIKVFMDSMIQ